MHQCQTRSKVKTKSKETRSAEVTELHVEPQKVWKKNAHKGLNVIYEARSQVVC